MPDRFSAFSFVDRITALEDGRRARGRFAIPAGLPAFSACLVTAAVGLIFGYAIIQWALHSPLNVSHERVSFGTYLYLSGVTFFTLGYGDITPLGRLGRTIEVFEAGNGFGLLAIVIGYLPVLYQSFSRRESAT